LMMALTEWSL